jgi:hypothetical protein
MRTEHDLTEEEGAEALDRVRLSAEGLKRYERSALERIARDKRANPFDVTPEQREIINGSLRRFPIYESPNSRVITGYGHQIVHPLVKLFEEGRIGQEEMDAAAKFQRDFNVATRAGRLTMKYGERLGVGGTPPSQQANMGDYCPETTRLNAQIKYRKVCDVIGQEQAPWLTAVICEIPIGEPGKVPSFEDVGREYAGCTNRPQATASGKALIADWTKRLPKLYGIR